MDHSHPSPRPVMDRPVLPHGSLSLRWSVTTTYWGCARKQRDSKVCIRHLGVCVRPSWHVQGALTPVTAYSRNVSHVCGDRSTLNMCLPACWVHKHAHWNNMHAERLLSAGHVITHPLIVFTCWRLLSWGAIGKSPSPDLWSLASWTLSLFFHAL